MTVLPRELWTIGRLAALAMVCTLRRGRHDERGQATVEWIALMIGFTALITVLVASDVWSRVGDIIVHTVDGILSKPADHDRV